ncbi:MAG: acetyl-CoA carboxylase biotin carboxyl carrier protein [Puniceicoccales bacterium]|nr:acetyl-CoA carboxylase biotin carboxyl carrier protein [Puniceicoccales bacterium]
MEVGEIERLAELAVRHDLDEVEVERNGVRVRLRRRRPPLTVVQPLPSMPAAGMTGFAPASPAPAAPSAPSGAPVAGKCADLPCILSPMIGTFYRSSAPGQPTFVEIGSVVTATTTVCIIEAMKVMNEIPSEMAGTIVEVLVKDGHTVEFGQPLFKIEPKV